MRSITLLCTLFALSVSSLSAAQHAQVHRAHVHAHSHRSLAEPAGPIVPVVENKKRNLRRRSCASPSDVFHSSGPNKSSAAPTSSSTPVTSSAPQAPPSPSPTPSPSPVTSSSSAPPPPPSSSAAPPPPSGPSSGHQFTLVNKCSNAIQPVLADTKCGYSPRCSGAASYSGSQPGSLAPGGSQTLTVDNDWVGRVFAQNGNCGAAGEDCTMTEFNLDTGSQWTPQSYDISNIQGFTQAISVGADGCDTVTCTDANCGCTNAYAVGDLTGCGADLPVRGCGAGPIGFTVVFCP